MSEDRSVVPCNGCRACCSQLVILTVEDEPSLYKTVQVKDRLALQHKPNGECVYLDSNGCTIWNFAPQICKAFDCRKFMARFTRTERRQLVRQKVLSPDIVKAAVERMHTL